MKPKDSPGPSSDFGSHEERQTEDTILKQDVVHLQPGLKIIFYMIYSSSLGLHYQLFTQEKYLSKCVAELPFSEMF